ncbi:5'/3'-nucleotidase SurE [Erythrobacter mangrovi]|uniref:5'-nucleotidase SurE n=1 Tax=Erythrobacter mangrovi TaxID=2739433 RepID=A0A7D4AUM3_9SPHN|nr:5'/3'-nucleotidase SurE [Erythrobacter mangrovi]QKG72037.1 5'/3'-nucleotidase SurE [Erythrobacter mangrovi]
MRILLTNDDGIRAPGLVVLEQIARQFSNDIWICAPDEEQSGMGHALTLTRPVRMRQHDERRFSVTGTPTDAVTLGLRKVMDGPPDLVLSGVNRGANLADDVTYSGTVSAAIEGALAGVRSIALSQVYAREGMGDDVPFGAAIEWGARVLGPLLETPLPKRTLVNVNFPALPPSEVKGIRIVRQGFHDYSRGTVVEGRDPRGYKYYWFGLEAIEHTLDHGTDLEAIDEGYISVTPLHLDLTHHASLGAMAERYG